MGRLSSSAFRRAVTNAVLSTDDRGLAVLSGSLPLGAAEPDPSRQLQHRQFVRELLHALTQLSGEHALPVLTTLLQASDPATRRESFIAASRYSEPEVETLALARLHDQDPEIRAAALDTLVRRGTPELGQKILEATLAAGDLRDRSLNEKRRLFAAVAKLCGEATLDLLSQKLLENEDRWFTSKKDKELAEAFAHGIRVVGTDRAMALLRHCAENGAKFVRAACAKELGA